MILGRLAGLAPGRASHCHGPLWGPGAPQAPQVLLSTRPAGAPLRPWAVVPVTSALLSNETADIVAALVARAHLLWFGKGSKAAKAAGIATEVSCMEARAGRAGTNSWTATISGQDSVIKRVIAL